MFQRSEEKLKGVVFITELLAIEKRSGFQVRQRLIVCFGGNVTCERFS